MCSVKCSQRQPLLSSIYCLSHFLHCIITIEKQVGGGTGYVLLNLSHFFSAVEYNVIFPSSMWMHGDR